MTLHNRTVRQDVRELGARLGEVIETQTSRRSFETVEACRQAAIGYRAGDRDSRAPLATRLEALSPSEQRIVARAFTTYFELVNLAEERERVRTLRRRVQAGTDAGGLAEAAEALGEAGPEAAAAALESVHVQPTFTAHPTEARRKTVKTKLRSVATHLETLDEGLLTDAEVERVWRDLGAEITSLWQTPQVRRRKPAPTDEARNVQWYLERTLYDVVPAVYDALEAALEETLEEPVAVPSLLSFRSWAGSDRDGNPHVTPAVTESTLERQRTVVLERHRRELERLSGVLSQDGGRVDVGEDLAARLAADRDRLPTVAEAARERYPGEPYRQVLALMRERLERVDDVRPGGYVDADELRADLEAIAASLRASDAGSVARAHVDPLRRQVETFGFTLADLDLREHRAVHTAAIDAVLDRQGLDYRARSEGERQALLAEAIAQPDPIVDLSDRDGLSPASARALEVFDRLPDWQRTYGESAIDTYCISMAEAPSHVLEVLFLADQAGAVSLPDHAGLDIVPLFETRTALEAADDVLATLFGTDVYASALAARGGRQEVMLGYSDTNKENGFLAANWSLYRTQRRLADVCSDHDVTLQLFHGRGGSISRGGGPMSEAMLALPNRTVSGPIKFTEQGEAIAEKYGTPRIAERNVEQMLGAQLRARLAAREEPTESLPPEWVAAMDAMATAARAAYRELLETEGFLRYFEGATPIGVIEDLDLGSRPASRTGERTVEDLRAIPWVFAWTQSRCILPGWYGVGAGLEAGRDRVGLETLRAMYDGWPFLRTTLDNASLALSRTDLEIAGEYADLVAPACRDRLFGAITAEYDRAVEAVTAVSDRDRLHPSDWLGETLERRNPYVDPLNLLQAHLLGRTHLTEVEERTLRLTVKGIAAGMKTTG